MNAVRSALVALALLSHGAALANDVVVLPIAGLLVDALETPGRIDRVSSTWGFADYATLFESRDVIEEIDDGQTVGTAWVSVGWFAIGTCSDVVAGSPIDNAWELKKLSLWGARWTLRGGYYRGGGTHDGEGVVTLCVERGLRKQLVLSRFFDASRGLPSRAELVAAIRKDTLLRRVYRAFRTDRVTTTAPARLASVVDHGQTPARREVLMFWTGVTIELPDDGFIWMAGSELAGIDRFERMAPALPELAVSLARIEVDIPCKDAFEQIDGAAAAAPPGLPAGWQAGPTVAGSGYHALSACYELPDALLVAAVVTAAKPPDFTPVAPLLDAIRAATEMPLPDSQHASPREARTTLPRAFLTMRPRASHRAPLFTSAR